MDNFELGRMKLRLEKDVATSREINEGDGKIHSFPVVTSAMFGIGFEGLRRNVPVKCGSIKE